MARVRGASEDRSVERSPVHDPRVKRPAADRVSSLVRWLFVLTLTAAMLAVAGPSAADAHARGHRRHHRHHHHRRHRHRHRHHGQGARSARGRGWRVEPPRECTDADTPAGKATTERLTAAVNCLINQERAKFGLPALRVSPKLTQSAQGWADYLGVSGQFFHGNVFGRITAAGYDWGEAGEDLAGGYITPRDVVAGWMGSREHCQNILWPDYTDMGAGLNTDPGGPIWNQDFALLITENAPANDFAPQRGCPYGMASSPYAGPTGPPCAPPWPCYPSQAGSDAAPSAGASGSTPAGASGSSGAGASGSRPSPTASGGG